MEKNSSKKGDIKISLFGLLIGISLIVAGVYGIVSNKIETKSIKIPLISELLMLSLRNVAERMKKMMLIS